jgi:hypothetical protein
MYADVAQNAEVTKLRVAERHLGPSHILINSCWLGLHVQERLQKVEDIREVGSDAVNLPPTAAPAVLSGGRR